ncbi:hypothetical protein [Aquabacterium sp.]|uniref:hypothetical protein n=1 Tax=Aquabacterium sp. TaxID=1872578 RepID=UPI003784EEE1
MKIHALTLVCRAALLTAATTVLLPAQAATAGRPHGEHAADTAAIEAVYRQERAKCLDGRSPQDRATCLQEAGAARAEALRGRLDNHEDAATLARNALQRCQSQPEADRADCERLARGEGERSGSVAAGGVFKQLITRTPAR